LKKNILGVTLARGGSKGIKNKNLSKINGKPLIFYTIKEAKKSKDITNYIVSTDSRIIKNIAKKYKNYRLRPSCCETNKSHTSKA